MGTRETLILSTPNGTLGQFPLCSFLDLKGEFTGEIRKGFGLSEKSVLNLKLKQYVVNLLVSLYPCAMLARIEMD